jgi:hypothetical protein
MVWMISLSITTAGDRSERIRLFETLGFSIVILRESKTGCDADYIYR